MIYRILQRGIQIVYDVMVDKGFPLVCGMLVDNAIGIF